MTGVRKVEKGREDCPDLESSGIKGRGTNVCNVLGAMCAGQFGRAGEIKLESQLGPVHGDFG